MKNFIRKILLIICIIVFCFSAYKLLEIRNKYKEVDNLNNEIYSEVVEEKTEEETPFKVDFDKLKELNSDSVAWFNIDNHFASYAVVQTTDNEYYLDHGFNKEYSFAGTLFVDYQNNSDFNDFNTIIYGHNMKNNSMFGFLNDYKSQSFYNQNPYIDLYLENGIKYRYQVFSVKEANVLDTTTYYLVSGKSETKQAMIDEMINTSLYDTGVSVSVDDKILTLSTCVDSLNDQYRFVVNAKLIEVSEYHFD